eukprot:symbB.v1.2.031736.t1/scaffold3715.1/size56643/2
MTEKALKGLHSSVDLVFKDPARKDYALKAVAVHGRALQFLSPQLRGDKEVVLKAVKCDGWALQWADQECRKDKDLVLKAMVKDVRSLQFAPQELLSDRDFAMEVVQINGRWIIIQLAHLKGLLAWFIMRIAKGGSICRRDPRQGCRHRDRRRMQVVGPWWMMRSIA